MHTDPLFAGGGKMGALIREYNWAQSPLGEPRAWPSSLRTAVSIMLNSHFGIYIAWGPDFIQFYNDAYRPILGSTKHPAIGKQTAETFHEAWHTIGPLFNTVMSGKAVGSEDWCLPLDRQGFLEECYFTFSYSPIMDNQHVGGVIVIVTETTKRVLQERRLANIRELARRVHATETVSEVWTAVQAALACNTYDIPYVFCWPQSVIPSVFDTVGLADIPKNGAALIGKSLNNNRLEASEGVTAFQAGPWGEPIRTLVAIPLACNAKQRHFGALLLGLSPRLMFDQDYQDYLETLAREIGTALNNVTAKMAEIQRAKALEDLNRSKALFIKNICYELQTPISLLMLPIEAFAASATSEQQPHIELVLHNARRLGRLVNNMLSVSRFESSDATARFAPTNLAEYTRDLAMNFDTLINLAGLKLEMHLDDLTESVYIDLEMWEKIVLNLLSNAFKFTLAGRIVISLTSNENEITLSVNDSGVGIATHNLPFIFDLFYRGDGKGRCIEGSGLGLSLVKQFVELHGGDIKCDSVFGQGTCFTVKIPKGYKHLPTSQLTRREYAGISSLSAKQLVDEAQRWLPQQTHLTESPNYLPNNKNILVIDNNPDMQHALQSILAPHFNVFCESDGKTAFALLQRQKIHLVLGDSLQPLTSELSLLGAMRESPALSNIPFISMSAKSVEDNHNVEAAVVAEDYLTKPFSSSELLSRIKQQFTLAELRHAMLDQAKLITDQASLLATSEKLRERKVLLSAIFDFAPMGITLANLKGDYVKTNRAFEVLVGYPESALLGVNLETVTLAEDWAKHACLREKLLAKKIEKFTVVKRLQRFDGSSIWTRHTVAPVTAADGCVSHTVALVEDISEERSSKAQIKLLSDRSQFLSELSLLALSETKLEPIIAFCLERILDLLPAIGIGLFMRQTDSHNYLLSYGSGALKNSHLPIIFSRHDLDMLFQDGLNDQTTQVFMQEQTKLIPCQLFDKLNNSKREKQIRSCIGSTLCSSSTLYGMLCAVSNHTACFKDDDINFLQACSSVLSATVDRSVFLKNLAANKELLFQAQELSGFAYWDLDLCSGKSKWSENLGRVIGLPETAEYKTLNGGLNAIHQDDRQRVREIIQRISLHGGKSDFICRINSEDNLERVLHIHCVGIAGEANTIEHILGTCLDITERKRHEIQLQDYADNLKALSRKLVFAQEDERKRLAIELHDQVGQNLTALSLSVTMLHQLLPSKSAAVKSKLNDINSIVEATNLSIEHIINDIRPPLLGDWGLYSALEWYVRNFKEHYGIEVFISKTGVQTKVNADIETALYRATQEALNNVVKHSGAEQVNVSLTWGSEYLCIDIIDDGRGMNLSSQNKNKGFGLTTMRERIEGVGGYFLSESIKNKGARVHFKVGYTL